MSMTDGDKQRFSVAITAVLETFGQEATKPMLMGYWLGLRDCEIDELELAVAKAIQDCSKRPMPAELREIIRGGSSEGRAVMAWADVQKAIPLGRYKHVAFDDVLINATIRSLGGWPALFDRCNTAENEKWYRIEFIKAYQAFASSDLSQDACRPLAGLSEVEIVDGKKAAPRPRRIACDPQRAKRLPDYRKVEKITQVHAVQEIPFRSVK